MTLFAILWTSYDCKLRNIVIPSVLSWLFRLSLSNIHFLVQVIIVYSIWRLFFFSHHNGIIGEEKSEEFKISCKSKRVSLNYICILECRIKTTGLKTLDTWNLILTERRKRKILNKWNDIWYGRQTELFLLIYLMWKTLTYFCNNSLNYEFYNFSFIFTLGGLIY